MPVFHMNWRINEACNFSCPYCFRAGLDRFRHAENPASVKYSPKELAASFDRTGQTWQVHITGGEPFLYPAFPVLCQLLAQRHLLSINTNLSTDNLADFIARVDPGRVHCLYAAWHVAEREKRLAEKAERFLDDVLSLQYAGFRVRVDYVAHPPLLNRIEADRAAALEKGIIEFRPKLFRGRYAGKIYPAAYTGEERKLFLQAGLSEREQAILEGNTRFWGMHCLSGHQAFSMDVSGNLFRCDTIRFPLGNFFAGDYRFLDNADPCPALHCNCPYQGLRFVLPIRGSRLGRLNQTCRIYGGLVRDRLKREMRRED